MNDPRSNASDAIQELQNQWSDGRRTRVEDLLPQFAGLRSDNDALMDLIYSEVLLREDAGDTVDEAEYKSRFPQLKEAISRQFQLHRVLDESPTAVDITTATAALTLDSNAPRQTRTRPSYWPRIPGFDIQSLAGRGGSGIAYRAVEEALNRVVAVKMLHGIDSDNEGRRKQLVREAEAAASLDHKSIVSIYQIGTYDDVPFIVMAFIDGPSLAVRLKEGPMPPEDAIPMMIEICNAVQYAHDSGVIHRDLKPGNVLLDPEGQPHICDFGLARQLDNDYTAHATGDVVGTPAYMSPEQARGEHVTTATDIYSLGAVLYHCLTGQAPFQAATPWEIMTQVLSEDPPSARLINATVPVDLDTICSMALQKNPARRIASAAFLADELKRFQSGQPILSRPSSKLERFWKLCRRFPAVSSLTLVSVCALAALTVITWLSAQQVADALDKSESALADAKSDRDTAFDAMKTLAIEVPDALQRREASIEARTEVLTSAITGLKKLYDADEERVDIALALSNALNRYGYVLSQQGKNGDAVSQYEEAVALTEQFRSPDALTETAQTYCNLAQQYLRTVEFDLAIEAAQRSITVAEDSIKISEDHFYPELIAGRSHFHLASAFLAMEKLDEAEEEAEIALTKERALLAEAPHDRRIVTQLADTNIQMSRLYTQLNKPQTADDCLTEAIKLIGQEQGKFEEDTEVAKRWYTAHLNLGSLKMTQLKHREAETVYRVALLGYQHFVDVEPDRPGYHLKLGSIQTGLANCLTGLGDLGEAKQLVRSSIEQFQLGMNLGGPEYRVQRWAIFMGHLTLGNIQFRQGQLSEGIQSLRTAAKELEPVAEEFQQQGAIDAVNYLAELISGIIAQPSEANPEHIEQVKQSYAIFRSAQKGDFQPLIGQAGDLRDKLQQIAAAIRQNPSIADSVLLDSMATHITLAAGLRYESVAAGAEQSDQDKEEALQAAIDAATFYLGLPAADATFYLSAPEFQSSRDTPEFRQALGLPQP